MDSPSTPTTGSDPALPARGFSRHLPTIARVLLGLMFFAFGLMGLFNLVPPPPPETLPPKLVAFSAAMMNTGYLFHLVKGTEVLVGALLLLNRFVPLALTLIAPVIVNIVAVHAFLAPSGLGMAIVILGLELFLAWSYRSAFRAMLGARVLPG
jgi:uncharacterized membrane protein YphA (DoxX/SURF4 family)